MALIQEQAGTIPAIGLSEREDGEKGQQAVKLPDDGILIKNPKPAEARMYYQDSTRRSIVKAISYRCLGVLVTGSVVMLVTHELKVAATIGVIDTVIKLGGYFVHERVWNRIDFGRPKPPEYEI